MKEPHDPWDSGDPYELFMGRWSKLIAHKFLAWLDIPEDRYWLDVGCGTGALSKAILTSCQPKGILGIDSSSEFINHNQQTNSDSRLHFDIGMAQSIPANSSQFDVAVSGLVLNFVSEPEKAVGEMLRVTRPGGVISVYVWDYADGMQMLRTFWDAAIALDAGASKLDEAVRFPLCQPDALEKLFLDSRLHKVTLKPVEVQTVFSSFEDYWQPFLGGVGPAPGYIKDLNDSQRSALKERLRSSLPISKDGSISLLARAWAIRGSV